MELARIKVQKVGKREWVVLEDFKGVPAGFISNGASVPRIFWWFLDPATEAFESAVMHDYALTLDGSKYKMESHKEFLKNLKEYKVPSYKALPAYAGVVAWHWAKASIK